MTDIDTIPAWARRDPDPLIAAAYAHSRDVVHATAALWLLDVLPGVAEPEGLHEPDAVAPPPYEDEQWGLTALGDDTPGMPSPATDPICREARRRATACRAWAERRAAAGERVATARAFYLPETVSDVRAWLNSLPGTSPVLDRLHAMSWETVEAFAFGRPGGGQDA